MTATAQPAAPISLDAGLSSPAALASLVLEVGAVVADASSYANDDVPMKEASVVDPLDASVLEAAAFVLPTVGASARREPAPKRFEPLLGSPADIHTRPGTFNGYWVGFGCASPGRSVPTTVVVLGMGALPFSESGDAWARYADVARLSAVAQKKAGAPSVFRTGADDPCLTVGPAIRLMVSDYRDVDTIIHRIGPWLARQNYGGEVLLWMGRKINFTGRALERHEREDNPPRRIGP